MISLKCPNCGFFFCVDFPDDISDEERKDLYTCPCGAKMDGEISTDNSTEKRTTQLISKVQFQCLLNILKVW